MARSGQTRTRTRARARKRARTQAPVVHPVPPAAPFAVAGIAVRTDDWDPVAEILQSVAGAGFFAIVIVPDGGPLDDRTPFVAPGAPVPLVEAEPGGAVEPGRVYLVSRQRPVVLRDGRFAAVPRGRRAGGPVPALFESLAAELGPAAIGVVLSGGARDAVDALRAVKQRGGATIVQDPAAAVYDEAPRAAVAGGLADHVLPPSAIGREVVNIASRPDDRDDGDEPEIDPRELDDEPLRQLLFLLKSRFQVDLRSYKLTTIRRRIERHMALGRFGQLSTYVEHLRDTPQALEDLHNDLFIHVTQFFRDPQAFAALRQSVFPGLLKLRGPEGIRVWVPGCSTGEEAYSLGIELTELLEESSVTARVQIFATDISEGAVRRARAGVYSHTMLAPVSPARLARFFEPVREGSYKVRKELRELCVISRHDVTNDPPFARLDLISCRNVLIYFGPTLQKRIVPIFHYALKTGGHLWLGSSETPGVTSRLFTLVDRQHKIYCKVPAPAASAHGPGGRFAAEKRSYARVARPERPELDVQRAADQLVLVKYGPPGVVIDQHLEILQFRGRTAPYLQPPAGAPSHNLLKMAHQDLLPALRRLVEAARKENQPVRRDGVLVEIDGVRRPLNLEVTPINPLAGERDRQLLVLFEEVAAAAPAAAKKPAPAAPAPRGRGQRADRDRYVEQLQQELDGLREHQQTLVEQFEASQEELTSANEELQATNEEFQSTNEELETAKEELQSANEELTTMNDELQSRNAELVEVNEKLARGEDRFRLMVEGVKDYAIYMLDPQGCIVSWNEGARRLKGYEAAEILGQHYSRFFPVEDVAARVPEDELERARIEGRYETEGWRIRKDGSRFWANVVVTRINDTSGTLIGFSKVTRDLTERRRSEEELERRERRFRLMISGVRDYAIFMLDAEGRVASWNEGARRLKGYSEEEILGKHFSIFYPPEDVAAGKIEREIAEALAEGRVEDEGWRVRKDGTHFWANVVITRVLDHQGQLIGFTKVTRDLSERRQAEQALRAANERLEQRVKERTAELEEALHSRDQFLSIASHELKTPLTSLKLQLQLARRAAERHAEAMPVEEATHSFDRALKQAVALEELVDDLLDVSRIQTGRFELELAEVKVGQLLEEVASRFAGQAAHARSRIELDLQDGMTARWDARRIGQVAVNLISNALKYAPGAPIRLSAAPDGADRIRIVVEDSGPGISAENRARVFDRFERAGAPTSVGGLGLGLFISRRIVEAHQGSIRVESEGGRGARFVVELPLRPPVGALRVDLAGEPPR